MSTLVGERFGSLTVVRPHGGRFWHAVCDCGRHKVTRADALTNGRARSCGCSRNKSGGHAVRRTPEYVTWAAIIERCTNEKSKDWHKYGGRGIGVCADWRNDFNVFFRDMGFRPPGLSIERIDNDKGYELGNCKWGTPLEQSRNRRSLRPITINGETLLLSDWAHRIGISVSAFQSRIARGWPLDQLLSKPDRSLRRV